MKIIKEELRFEECLKQRLEFICEFSKVTPTFVNGSIRKLEKIDIQKFNKEYPVLRVAKINKFHDRFIVIDNKENIEIAKIIALLHDIGRSIVLGLHKMII